VDPARRRIQRSSVTGYCLITINQDATMGPCGVACFRIDRGQCAHRTAVIGEDDLVVGFVVHMPPADFDFDLLDPERAFSGRTWSQSNRRRSLGSSRSLCRLPTRLE
jgi:hypothetical protein